ncbi:MAG: preprotein translocase subunit SecY [Alphaproteobacteria bacterium]|nr:preprotein translocase subunit SecY [Alphaproteobacteria bacterium]NCB50010.1 preprotein translocase subunit SecY [Alphaproteobacteria bacterium]
MASLSEKMAQEMNFSAFSKAGDVQKRILFTLGALIIFRFGAFIPLPGIDPNIFKGIFEQNAGGILGMFDAFSGGALSRMSLLALNIMPYISASIIIQLGASIFPALIALKKEGASGMRKMNQYTRYLTVLIASLQGYGLALALEKMTGASGASAVIMDNLPLFRLMTVVSLLGGTMFVVWLGEQITARGVGNGSSLIITVGIIATFPGSFSRMLELVRVGEISPILLLGLLALAFGLISLVVMMERAQRRIVIQYPKRGQMTYNGDMSHLPLKINPTGVMPPIFASALLLLPMSIIKFSAESNTHSEWLNWLAGNLSHGQWGYIGLYGFLIAFFTFFYTGLVFNPKETADNLKKYGGFVAGIRPGKSTADYLDYVITRITVLAAIYLVGLCILPEILISQLSVPFFLGGTTLLIVVTVIMDTITQIQSQLFAYQYESLIKKAKTKGRFR